jgi:hypothetical protein
LERVSRAEDAESQPALADTGVISIKKKVMIQTAKSPSPVSYEAQSAMSMRSSISQISRVTGLGQQPKTTEQPIKEHVPVPIDVPVVEESEFDEVNRQRISLKIATAKQEEQRKLKEQRDAFEVARKRVRDQAELQKKALTYDYEGKIVFTQPLVTKQTLYQPKYEVLTQQSLSKDKRARSVTMTFKDKQTPMREVEFVKSIKTASMWDVINSRSGVVIREGSKAKAGPAVARQLSRKEYMRQAKGAPSVSVLRHSSREPREDLSPAKSLVPQTVSDVPDYDLPPLPNEPRGRVTPLVQGQPRIVQYTIKEASAVEELTEVDQFNLSILEKKDWGMNPPVRTVRIVERLPKRPDRRTLRMTHGHKQRLPRERALNEYVGKRLNISAMSDSTTDASYRR